VPLAPLSLLLARGARLPAWAAWTACACACLRMPCPPVMNSGGRSSVDMSMRVTAQQDPCLRSMVGERAGSEQHDRRHMYAPMTQARAACVHIHALQ